MKDSEIIDLGKVVFEMFLVLGTTCLVGAWATKLDAFAAGGYLLLILGTVINSAIVLWLLIYGLIYRSRLNACLRAILILMINIPVAVIYAFIGVNIP